MFIEHLSDVGGGATPISSVIKAGEDLQSEEDRAQVYRTIYNSNRKSVFLNNQTFQVSVSSYVRIESIAELHHTVFTVVICHGPFSWNIRKRGKDFQELQNAVNQAHKTLNFLAPPKLPNRFYLAYKHLNRDNIQDTTKMFDDYLQHVVTIPELMQMPKIFSFFGISKYSFISSLGPKLHEGIVVKRSGGQRFRLGCSVCQFRFSKKEWLIVKDSYLFYVTPETGEIRGVLLFDSNTNIIFGKTQTTDRRGLYVCTTYRDLELHFEHSFQMTEWIRDIGKAICDSSWTQENRFLSYAPPRTMTYKKWYVDGRGYFSDVADAIANAKEDIFIEDWWLSPELYLKRPPHLNEAWRLDRLLKRKAEEGVKVVVLLYKNVEMAVSINSLYSKRKLTSMHENISVMRHPDHPPDGVWLWAHHEKICVVDQKIAFIGGIDLCFGRDDTPEHEMTDVYAAPTPEEEEASIGCFQVKVVKIINFPTVKLKKRARQSFRQKFNLHGHHNVDNKAGGSNNGHLDFEDDEDDDEEELSRLENAKEAARTNWNHLRSKVFQKIDSSGLKVNIEENEDSILRAPSGRREDAEAELMASGFGGHSAFPIKTPTGTGHRTRYARSVSGYESLSTDGYGSKGGNSQTSASVPKLWSIVDRVTKHGKQSALKEEEQPLTGGTTVKYAAADELIPSKIINRQISEPSSSGGSHLARSHTIQGYTSTTNNYNNDMVNSFQGSESTTVPDIYVKKPAALRKSKSINGGNYNTTNRRSIFDSKKTKLDRSDSTKIKVVKKNLATVEVLYGSYLHEKEVEIDQEININQVHNFSFKDRKTNEISIKLSTANDDYEYVLGEALLSKAEIQVTKQPKSINLPLRIRRSKDSSDENNLFEEAIVVIEYIYYKGVKPQMNSHPTWVGKDYSNPVTRDFFSLDKPEEDSIDRWTQPRMPWHDIAVSMIGQAARDVARHFIQRYNHVKSTKAKRDPKIPFLLPKADLNDDEMPACPVGYHSTTSQIIRSSGMWSNGIEVERSIQNAYIEAIQNAKHYIYIENQFFVSSLPEHGVTNKVGDAIISRISKAYHNNEIFRVYICLPLMPGFEGELGENTSSGITTVMHWQFMSLTKGNSSLLRRIDAIVGDSSRYISINCLRKYDKLYENYIDNQIYIHSKLMIVDDNVALCGSANINDRSLMGSRDSEIATFVRDNEYVDVKLNSQLHKAGKSIYDLRKQLFAEHLGVSEEIAGMDCVCEEFFTGIWKITASNNTEIYDQVFNAVPNNHTRTWAELALLKSQKSIAQTNTEEAEKRLALSRGHLVEFPEHFLENEYIGPTLGDREYYVPMKTFL